MTAKKQVPLEPVQWVLNFLNLGCIPGEPNPWRLPDEKRKLKRPPLPQNPSGLKKEEKIPGFPSFIDIKKKYIFGLNDKGKYVFDGRDSVPTTEDFRDFFLKYGIPPEKGEDITFCGNIKIKDWKTRKPPADRDSTEFRQWLYFPTLGEELRIQIIELWKELSDKFLGVAWAPDAGKRKSVYASFNSFIEHILKLYRKCLEEDEIPAKDYKSNMGRGFEGYGINTITNKGLLSIEPFFHYGDLPQALYAIILDFANHFKVLHEYLRQCPYCGRFWIPEKKRGRPDVFCDEICNMAFHKQSREKNKKTVATTREHQKPKKQKEDYKTLVGYLKQKGHPEKESKEIAQEWVYIYGKSFKEYKRTQGAMY